MMMTKPELQYSRPVNWDELEGLRQEFQGRIMYLAGGDYHPRVEETAAVLVDLQDLELDQVEFTDEAISLGGLCSLQQLGNALESDDLLEAISIEAGVNLRNSLSLNNYIRHSNGRSAVQVCLNALEAEYLLGGEEAFQKHSRSLKTKLDDDFLETIRVNQPVSLAFASVARSPKDQPIVMVAVSKRSDARFHVACGGAESLDASFDLYYGEDDGISTIKELYKDADDAWASAEYRQDIAAILLSRCLQKLWRLTNTKEEA